MPDPTPAAPRSEPLPNPLRELHGQAEAEFQAYGDVEIVSTFGEPQAEYSAIRKGCALIDLPQRGLLELTGRDRLSFLNSLLTNQVYDRTAKAGIASGTGVYAFLLHAKNGRISADMNVWELGDRTLLELDARLMDGVVSQLNRYLFAEQVKVTPKLGELHQIALHGPASIELIAEVSGVTDLKPMTARSAVMADIPVIICRDDSAATSGFDIIVPTVSAKRIWLELVSRYSQPGDIGKRRLRPAGWAVYNAARIEAGRPIFGIDFDDTILPAETGQLARAVSFTKGCYPGQEIVARMHARQQLARQMVGIRMADDHLPVAGSPVHDEQSNTIGGITSSTISPVLSNAAICLGIVKKPFFSVGTVVTIPAEGKLRRGVVTETPFILTTPA